jgi:hypothetical protein
MVLESGHLLAAAITEGEIEAIALGPLAHGIVTHAKHLAQGGPVADLLHELAEFVGTRSSDFALGELAAGGAAIEFAAEGALYTLAHGFEGVTTGGAGVSLSWLMAKDGQAVFATTEDAQVLGSVVGAITHSATRRCS